MSDLQDSKNTHDQPTEEAINLCLEVLETLVSDTTSLMKLSEEKRTGLIKLAGRLSRPNRDEIRVRNRYKRKIKKELITANDKAARECTGIRSARKNTVFDTPKRIETGELNPENFLSSPRNCYVCKSEYTAVHHFYDSMCMDCADFNYLKRFQTADLTGQVALITGSRLKIGYQATLMMLRAGATVIATTRFPVDSAIRYAKEEDFKDWSDRLQIHGLDLRHIPSVELFATYIEQHYDRLDILINNAAQTVRRPPGFYAHLMKNENLDFDEMSIPVKSLLNNHQECLNKLNQVGVLEKSDKTLVPVSWNSREPGLGLRASARLSQIPYSFDYSIDTSEVFPVGKLDADLQQVDLRKTNSWRLKLGEVQTPELLEVQLVNAVAPFVLCNRLIALMKRDNTGQKHIVNVTAMEGKFYRFKKEPRHPHTNMAKAALNMFTHTSAGDLAKDGIFMNAVDTGWVTDEDPAELAKLKEKQHDFQPPLDIVDGAARICDPFFDGINRGSHWCGKFLKDYHPIDW